MVERRKPLVLSSTKALVNSLLTTSISTQSDQTPPLTTAVDHRSNTLCLRGGVLNFLKNKEELLNSKLVSLDEAVLVGVSTCVLKQLSITSGELVSICNNETKVRRIGQAVVLDRPNVEENLTCNKSISSDSEPRTFFLPSCNYPQVHDAALDYKVAYLSPLLAFNLNLHMSYLKCIVQQGKESLSALFEVEEDRKMIDVSDIKLGLEPLTQLPKYASHLRTSFVKIPECGTLEALRKGPVMEAEDRQQLIDSSLNNYFAVDRYLARGDVFSVTINWKCNSSLCIPCCKKIHNCENDIIYFKVVGMEPSEEHVLRVHRNQTALVLGGSVPSAVPPELLIPGQKGFVPLQQDIVTSLASILTPPLCPSALSTKLRVSVLLYGLSGVGKRTVVQYIARRLGLHVVEYSCHDLLTSTERKTSVALAQAFSAARRYSPAILLLRHFEVFRNVAATESSPHEQVGVNSEVASVIKEWTEPITGNHKDDYSDEKSYSDTKVNYYERVNSHPVLLVAAADRSEGLPATIRRCFTHEVSMGPLTEEQRKQMLSQSLQDVSKLLPNVSAEDLVKDIVGQTSGFMPRDLMSLIADAGANLVSSCKIPSGVHNETIGPDSEPVNSRSNHDVARSLDKDDLVEALDRSKKRNASALGTPKVPDVKWEDVGGLEDVKKSILDTVQLPLLHKDLFSSGLRKRSGVLLYGPPGTGKTLLAKAVATECSLNFLSVKGPELINMYIGESEKNVRDIFQKARSARPCVIFFDELDSLAPARGASGDSGGVMDRVVSQMLAEIDGLNDSTQDLFIIGASNRPDLIDPALLRPGRFDKLLYIGVNSETSYRERVLRALTRKFKLHDDVSLHAIAEKCPPNFTGADMYALCADAWFQAAKRKVSAGNLATATSDDDQPES
ncbi:hypothetical protein Leryth_009024 [Lithospermum erythrorhizon]|nr:hypothetical protein Leryth_009024 [Lithospermum erythrorhizon]